MKFFVKTGLLMVLCGLLWGCESRLNVYPTSSEVDGKVIVDAQSARTTLNGVYYQFANAGSDVYGNPAVKWCSVNEIIPSELSGLITYPFGGSVLADHTYDATTNGVGTLWSYSYKIVNNVNGFLKNLKSVNNIPDKEKKQMAAEAKFLRVYANATLLFYYGQYNNLNSPYGVILRKHFVNSDNIELPRSTVKESYDFVLSDIKDAIAGLPNLNSKIYYANVWAAKLLKARVLMERGKSGDFQEVVTICKDIISNSPFDLEANTKNIFLSKGLNSDEVILGIKPYDNDVYKYNEYLFFQDAVGSDSLKSRLQNDPRKSMLETINYRGSSSNPTPNSFTKYYSGPAPNPSQEPISSVSYPMRLTEAYLLEAEAIATLDSGNLDKAKGLLKTVMGHAGFKDFSKVDATNNAADLKLLIIKEEMINFVGEAGQDWLAVRRLPFATLQQLIPTIKSKTQLILPIPHNEIMRNKKIKQNPGYSQ